MNKAVASVDCGTLSGLAEKGKDDRCKILIKVINGQVHKSKASSAMVRR